MAPIKTPGIRYKSAHKMAEGVAAKRKFPQFVLNILRVFPQKSVFEEERENSEEKGVSLTCVYMFVTGPALMKILQKFTNFSPSFDGCTPRPSISSSSRMEMRSLTRVCS